MFAWLKEYEPNTFCKENCFVFSPLRFLGTISYLPRILPVRGQGEKYNSSKVIVFYFTLTIFCLRFLPRVPYSYFAFTPLKVDSEIQSDFKRTQCISAGHLQNFPLTPLHDIELPQCASHCFESKMYM